MTSGEIWIAKRRALCTDWVQPRTVTSTTGLAPVPPAALNLEVAGTARAVRRGTFTADGPGRTQVVLTHRHLDRHGDGWQSMRDAVGSGWDLTRYAEVAGQPA